jgi:hypothetical protein
MVHMRELERVVRRVEHGPPSVLRDANLWRLPAADYAGSFTRPGHTGGTVRGVLLVLLLMGTVAALLALVG